MDLLQKTYFKGHLLVIDLSLQNWSLKIWFLKSGLQANSNIWKYKLHPETFCLDSVTFRFPPTSSQKTLPNLFHPINYRCWWSISTFNWTVDPRDNFTYFSFNGIYVFRLFSAFDYLEEPLVVYQVKWHD